jgi:spectinomycin phosphotransferase/16S rRNA (guanine(1405)-N(7))-methyltransferase
VLTQPVDLNESALVDLLARAWGLRSTATAYLPVGAGSHHWRVEDVGGLLWFVTVDDLDARRHDSSESRSEVFDRLGAALAAAHALRETGAEFVVAPIAAGDGEVLHRVDERWAVAVYPMVVGETFRGGQAMPIADRLAVTALVAGVHAAPASARDRARSDDFALQNRADLERAVRMPPHDAGAGPHTVVLAEVVATYTPVITELLAEYDDLVAEARAHGDRDVLTHGEPHAGNVMRTAAGWTLVDWDTTLVAAPERDLWMLEPGDGAATAVYTAATGTPIIPALLDLFRLRWDLSDLGSYVAQLQASRQTSADDDKAWTGVTRILERRASGGTIPPAAWR